MLSGMHKLITYIAAAFFSIAFCFAVFSSCTRDPVQTDLLLPVDFSNIPENMVLTGFHTDKIEIKIQADSRLIEKFIKKDFRYFVDLYTDLEFDPAGDTDSIEPGDYLIPVEKKRIPLSSKIKILSMDPTYLSVQLDKKIKKTLKITVPYSGRPPTGYMVLEAAAEPSQIELEGAFSLLDPINEVKTKPVDLTNVNETFKKNIPLDIIDPSMVSKPDNIVMVTIPVKEMMVEKTIRDLPVNLLNTKAIASIEPHKITIKIKGPFETLSNKELLKNIYSFIDLNHLKSGVYARHAYIDIPVGIVMTDAEPRVFTVKID